MVIIIIIFYIQIFIEILLKEKKIFGDSDSGTVSKNNFTTSMTVDNGRQRKVTMSNDSIVAESKT